MSSSSRRDASPPPPQAPSAARRPPPSDYLSGLRLFPPRVLFFAPFTLCWLLLRASCREVVLVFWLFGYLGYANASAPGPGLPNALEVWLRSRGYVSSGFSVSLKGRIPLRIFKRYVCVHLHHWLYTLFIFSAVKVTRRGGKLEPFGVRSLAMDALEAACLGGFTQGMTYDDWGRVLWIEGGD